MLLVLCAVLPFGCQCWEGTLLSSTGLGRHCEPEDNMILVLELYILLMYM
jgi:hypothetical protein